MATLVIVIPTDPRPDVPAIHAQPPDSPSIAFGHVGAFGGTTWGLAVDGGTAWLGIGRRLVGVDLADPRRPAYRTAVDIERITGIALRDGHAFVSARDGLHVFDVRRPAAIYEVARLATRDPPDSWLSSTGLVVAGRHAFMRISRPGGEDVLVVDVSRPEAPVARGTIALERPYMALAATGDLLIAAWSKIQVYSVADPDAPALVGEADAAGAVIRHLAVAGDRVFAGGDIATQSLAVLLGVDLTDPRQPRGVANYRFGGRTPARRLTAIAADGSRVWVATQERDLWLMDMSRPAQPTIAHAARLDGRVDAIAVDGPRLWLTSFDGGLRGLDVSDPARPAPLGRYVEPPLPDDVVVRGGLAYVADNNTELFVLDVADPARPRTIGHLDVPVSPPSAQPTATPMGLSRLPRARLDVVGHLAAMTSGQPPFRPGMLRLCDVSDAAAPRPLATVATGGSAEVARLAGAFAFVADGVGGLRVYDVDEPTAPRVIATLGAIEIGTVSGLARKGDRLYLATSDGFLEVDVSLPSRPVIAARIDGHSLDDVAIVGDLAYAVGMVDLPLGGVPEPRQTASPEPQSTASPEPQSTASPPPAWSAPGLAVIDVSRPGAPVVLGRSPLGDVPALSEPMRVASDGRRAYVVGVQGGLAVIDVADAGQPRPMAIQAPPGAASELVGSVSSFAGGLAVAGDLLYVASRGQGLLVLRPVVSDAPRPGATSTGAIPPTATATTTRIPPLPSQTPDQAPVRRVFLPWNQTP